MGGGEEHALTFGFGENLDDLLHFIFETDFEDAVGFVDDEGLDVLVDEALSVLQVIQQTTGSRDEQVNTLCQLLGLGTSVGSSDDDTKRLRVVRHELTSDAKDLEREFGRFGPIERIRIVLDSGESEVKQEEDEEAQVKREEEEKQMLLAHGVNRKKKLKKAKSAKKATRKGKSRGYAFVVFEREKDMKGTSHYPKY